MPRKYIRKTNSNYSNDVIDHALADIENKKLIVTDVARQYNIPVTTLYSRLSRRTGNTSRGRSPILSKDEEQFLVYVIELFQEWQQPLTRKCVIDMARTYMIELGKKISPNARLIEWFHSFMTRWRDRVKMASSMNLERIRSQSCTNEVISKFYRSKKDVFIYLALLISI